MNQDASTCQFLPPQLQRRRRKISLALLAITVLAALTPLIAAAESASDRYPTRPIKLVVPFPPGGATDLLARTLAEALRNSLGQSVVVDNRPGAGGLIGTELVSSAPADGYTLLLTSLNNHIMLPLIQKTRFDPIRDLASVGLAVRANTAVLVSDAVPAKTLHEFVEFSRKNPGKVNYSSSGNGSFGHFFTELFKSQAAIDVVHVPYKGAAPSVMALVSNEVQLLIVAYSVVQPYVEAGQIKVLAQDGSKRSPQLPSVPTMTEAGFPEFQPTFWLGISAPKNTPKEILEKINRTLNATLGSPAFVEVARKNAWTPLPGSPHDMDLMVARDLQQYGESVRKMNIKID